MEPQADPGERREFPPKPGAVADARSFLRQRLPAEPVAELAVWLASELATNAVVHARSPFRVAVRVTHDSVQVAIDDDNPRIPTIARTDAEATSGRGLTILDAVADRWGVETVGAGKRIWFELRRGR